jgi:hypothetical protein
MYRRLSFLVAPTPPLRFDTAGTNGRTLDEKAVENRVHERSIRGQC